MQVQTKTEFQFVNLAKKKQVKKKNARQELTGFQSQNLANVKQVKKGIQDVNMYTFLLQLSKCILG